MPALVPLTAHELMSLHGLNVEQGLRQGYCIAGHVKIADHTTLLAQAGVIGNIRKEGQTLLGSPCIDPHVYMKAYAKFRQSGQE